MQQLLGEKRFPFATSVENLQDGLFGCPHEFQMLPKESFLGSGGNGVTAEHMLSGQKYALKWVSINK